MVGIMVVVISSVKTGTYGARQVVPGRESACRFACAEPELILH